MWAAAAAASMDKQELEREAELGELELAQMLALESSPRSELVEASE